MPFKDKKEVWSGGTSQYLFEGEINTTPMPIVKDENIKQEITYQDFIEIGNGKLVLTHPDTKERMTIEEPLKLIREIFNKY